MADPNLIQFVERAVASGQDELTTAVTTGSDFLVSREYRLLKAAVLTSRVWLYGQLDGADENGVPLTLATESAEAILGEAFEK